MGKAWIFDFDGTLVDSADAIYKIFQDVTAIIAPDRINESKNVLIGPPLKETVKTILGKKQEEKASIFIDMFINLHDKHVTNNCYPYPGASEILSLFYKHQLPMAIATNKRKYPTLKLIEHFGWTNYFTAIECSDSYSLNRNKTDMIKSIVKNNSQFIGSYYVGDTLGDGLSANANNMPFIRANYGYGANNDWSKTKIYKTINAIEELLVLSKAK